MTSVRTASCVLCGRTARLASNTVAVQLDCPDCGPFEVTIGVISHLRTDARSKAAVRAEIRRQLDTGVARPHINLETLKALKAR
jgi:predicted RNA-binding Zn-ribbon protein involved in translation (DUF1610 family)